MKKYWNTKNLPYAVAGMGLAGLVLRLCLYTFAVDEKNLLTANHPLEIALWVLAAVAAVLVVTVVWKLDGSNRYADNFTPSASAAVGAFALAVGILATVLADWGTAGIGLARNLVGVLAAASLIVTGISRWKGRRPLFLFHLTVCVFFALQNVSHYQSWSGNPQFQDYVFSLWASLTLMLFAFYQASFDVGSGRRRMQLSMGLLAGFCGLTAMAGSQEPILYLTGSIWAFANLCTLEPVPRQKNPGAEAPKE